MPKANFVKPTSRGVLKKAVDVCPKIKKLKDNRTEQRRLENLLKLLQQEEVKLQQDPAITGCFPDHPAVNALSDGKGSRKGPSIQWSTSLDGKSSSKKSNTGSGKAAKKPDNSTVFDVLSDVFHGSILANLPPHSLISLSMVSRRGKELVDTAPQKLKLWSFSDRFLKWQIQTMKSLALLPRIKAALVLACKCQRCEKQSSMRMSQDSTRRLGSSLCKDHPSGKGRNRWTKKRSRNS